MKGLFFKINKKIFYLFFYKSGKNIPQKKVELCISNKIYFLNPRIFYNTFEEEEKPTVLTDFSLIVSEEANACFQVLVQSTAIIYSLFF